MNGGFVAKGNKKTPVRYSRVTKKPIIASNKNTSTPKTTPPVYPNIPQFRKGKSNPLPVQGKVTAK